MQQARAVVVIGASAGGVEALLSLAAGLPADLPAAVLVVLHVGAHKSELPALLSRAGPLPACHPGDGDPIEAGRIYVAPPDLHMTVEPGHVRLTRGPRENWARPAIDPLFRSAALAYGPAAVGVILTGALNDGTAGLFEIKARGGAAVVQDPDDAVSPSMPRSALAHVAIDCRATLAELPRVIFRLAAERAAAVPDTHTLASERRQDMTASYTHSRPAALTCPDCGGALRRGELGRLTQFRCHIGHVYTAEAMAAAQLAALERSLETALRALRERGELCGQMAETAREGGDPPAERRWDAARELAGRQAAALEKLLADGAEAG